MANAPETLTTLNGLVKEVYADGEVPVLVPDETRIQKLISFVPREKELGNKYHQPVVLNLPSGFTQAGPGAGAVSLNDSKAGQMKDAQIDGYSVLLRNQVDYEIAARSSRGRNAFMDVMPLVFETMSLAMRKRLECQLLYGSIGVGQVLSYSVPAITIDTSYFAPGIWSMMEGMEVTVYNGTSTTPRGSDTIAAVDIDARTITLTTGIAGTVVGDKIYFKNGNTSAPEMSGIHKILTNTGSLFNIDASAYSGWKSPSYSAGSGALSFEKVRKAVSLAVGRGLAESVTLLVATKTWDDLMNDLAALRRFDKGEGKAGAYETGAESIKFYSQNGSIEIVPSIYVWEGYAYGITPKKWVRGGAADVSFKTPGMGDDIFLHLPSNMGYEVRSYCNQFIFTEKPASQFLITNIVNST